MDNTCESNISSTGRNFGHCIVSWEIQNYGRALWKKNLEIKTPEFSIKFGSRNTKWNLILQTETNPNSLVEGLNGKVNFKGKEENPNAVSEALSDINFNFHLREDEKQIFNDLCLNENKNVVSSLSVKNLMLYLERVCPGGELESVCVDWKVYYIGIKGEKISLVNDEHVFYRKSKYGFNIGTLYDFERDFEYNSGLTTILCDMIITDTHSSETFNEEISIDLYGLSEDLQCIFDRQMLCDAEIKVGETSVKAHKAVLCSHSEIFKHAFEEGSNVFELCDMKYNQVLKIFEYMYSHDLKYVIGKPSLSVFDAAVQLNLSDLYAHYEPEEVKINTKIDVKKLTYAWTIKDFSKQNYISSSIIKTNHDDTAWQINLYPKGIDGKSEYIALSVECFDGNITDDLCIQCAVLRNNENLNIWKNLQKAEDDNTVARDLQFMLREDVVKLLTNDCLRLGFKVRTWSGKKCTVVNEPCTPVLYSMKKSFEDLTRNMQFLRESKKYADVTLSLGKKEIKAHKFVLSSRSHAFCKQFEETCNRLPLLNIHPQTFEIVLDYMYYATFNASNLNTVINVYKCAEELLIPRLKEKCSRFLQNCVSIENVIRIFMLANEYDDNYVKEKAEEFIEINKHAFEQQNAKKQKLVTCGAETAPKKRDDVVTASCITKCTSVIKYDKVTIVKYDFEFDETSLNRSVSQAKENGESSPDDTTAIKTVSDDIATEFLEEVRSIRENKSLADKQKPVVHYIDYSRKIVESDELNAPSINKYNGINFSDSILGTNANNQDDKEMTYVHIDSKGKEIKENLSPYKKEMSLTPGQKVAFKPKAQNSVTDLYQSMQLCLEDLHACQKELDAEISKKKEASGNGQESLYEQRSNSKSNVDQKEPLKGLKPDTALSELHGNGQEFSYEQRGSNFKLNVVQSVSKVCVKIDDALNDLHGNGKESLERQS